ncbi:MAG: endonuclease/exonuclease/phosphatase family protein [Pseudomonadota bacterium]
MRIATFNLESLDLPPRANRSITQRIAMLRPDLVRAEADIVCLQEVNAQHEPGHSERTLAALDALLADTPYSRFHRAVSRPSGGERISDIHNLVTLSRWPITTQESIHNDLVPAGHHRFITAEPAVDGMQDLAFDRPILLTDVHLPDDTHLAVINCHLRAPLASSVPGQKLAPFVWKTVGGWGEGFCLSSIKRNMQALEVRFLVDRLQAESDGRAVVVAGDFNAEDYDSPLRIISGAEQDTGNGALAHAALIVLDRSICDNRRFSVIHQGRPQMLDHILVSRSVYGRFRSIEVFNEALSDEAVGFARVDRPTGSYHACVVAEFADLN